MGTILGPDGPIRLSIGLLRMPDVCFISSRRLPAGKRPRGPFLDVAPDLVVEVLSPSNTAREMDGKNREYFAAGVRLVWLVDPHTRTVHVLTAPDESRTLKISQTLTGGSVLPGR